MAIGRSEAVGSLRGRERERERGRGRGGREGEGEGKGERERVRLSNVVSMLSTTQGIVSTEQDKLMWWYTLCPPTHLVEPQFSADSMAISKETGSSAGRSGRRSEVRKLNISGGDLILQRESGDS